MSTRASSPSAGTTSFDGSADASERLHSSDPYRGSRPPMNDDSLQLAFGISLEEQMAYEFLLANPGSTAADVARDTSWSSRRAGHVLRSLETKGMASCLPERTPRYVPTSPEVTLDLLTARKQNELQRAYDCRSLAVEGSAQLLAGAADRAHHRARSDPAHVQPDASFGATGGHLSRATAVRDATGL